MKTLVLLGSSIERQVDRALEAKRECPVFLGGDRHMMVAAAIFSYVCLPKSTSWYLYCVISEWAVASPKGSNMPEIPSVWSLDLAAHPGTVEPGAVDCCSFPGPWETVSSRAHSWAPRFQSGLQDSGSPWAHRLPTPGLSFCGQSLPDLLGQVSWSRLTFGWPETVIKCLVFCSSLGILHGHLLNPLIQQDHSCLFA